MDQQPPPDSSPPAKQPWRPHVPTGLLLILVAVTAAMLWIQPYATDVSKIKNYKFFHDQVLAGNVESVEIRGDRIYGVFVHPPLAASSNPTIQNPSGAPSPKPTAPVISETTATTDSSSTTKEDTKSVKPSVVNGATKNPQRERLEKNFTVQVVGEVDDHLRNFLLNNVAEVRSSRPFDFNELLTMAWLVLLVFLALSFWKFMRRTRDQVMGGGMLSGVTRSPARKYDADGSKVSFDDVAGLIGVKKDLQEIVEFLKDPDKFQRLGARVPKGVLLMGPPGTGKTLLARAVAGEAHAPFFSINGSEFIQLFVGVGAGRVRDMFKTAKENAPAILFIDEIDAVGRQRGTGLGGGNDEREQTLNQILSEMDGFGPAPSVIVLAATNRPDVLDPALLRPGRFDRHITVDRPNAKDREELFNVHSREIPVADNVDFTRLARATVGLTGADVRNLVNEAALWATRHDRNQVGMDDFEYARDKVLMGSSRDDVLSDKEQLITAYHEGGHALAAWLVPGCDRVHKVTIVPRGRALGVTQLVPDEDRHNISQRDIRARLVMLLAGRAAEKFRFDEYSGGAENDLKEATKIARRMVTHWGMSERLGPVAFHTSEDHPFLGREMAHEHRHFSDHTAQLIDEEVAKILHTAEDRAKQMLSEHPDMLTTLAEALIKDEVLDEDQIGQLIGPSVHQQADGNKVAEVNVTEATQVAAIQPIQRNTR
jgi:cell division protease FtsH